MAKPSSNSQSLADIKPVSKGVYSLSGDWTATKLGAVVKKTRAMVWHAEPKKIEFVAAAMTAFDSAGAIFLHDLIEHVQDRGIEVKLSGLKPEFNALIELLKRSRPDEKPPAPPQKESFFHMVGRETVTLWRNLPKVFDFWGRICVGIAKSVMQPTSIYWRTLLKTIETAGYNALPIIGLLSFLIGVVLAYQSGVQLRTYGANIFIVDLIGIAIFREFGPLITAILLAGRTGSAFTAQLGSMKINEELDALQTMGVPPLNLLVLPKLFAMLIVVPLLVVWSDFFGVLGGMIMAKPMLGITYQTFLKRFEESVSLTSYNIGLVKAPVFALIITLIGCYQGFQVRLSADSVGNQTTRSVVQAIFFIIVADAAFSIYFSWRGI